MSAPRPGGRVRGSRTGRPLVVLLDLLGRRGALRMLWELRAERLTFRALQAASEMSPSVLNTRLAEWRELALLDHSDEGYGLTPDGRRLFERLAPLQTWAEAWARRGGE